MMDNSMFENNKYVEKFLRQLKHHIINNLKEKEYVEFVNSFKSTENIEVETYSEIYQVLAGRMSIDYLVKKLLSLLKID